MTQVSISAPKQDSIDLEHLEQTLLESGWEMIRDRLLDMQRQASANLLAAETPNEFFLAKGALLMINRVIELPAILRRELKERNA